VRTDPRPPAATKPSEPTTPIAPVSGPKPGTIDVAATQTTIRPHLGSIQRCYERAKMDDLSLAGSVTVRISIGPDGSVTNAAVAKSTLGSPAAEHCITQEISSWHLPEPSGGVASSLIYPFVFE
jgi:TonB family protein